MPLGGPLQEVKSFWELSAVSSQFNASAKPEFVISLQYGIGLNFKPFPPFSVFAFPSSEPFQSCLLVHLHLNGVPGVLGVCNAKHHPVGYLTLAVPCIVALSPLPPAAGSPGPTHSFINPFHSVLVCSYPLRHGEKIAVPGTNKNSSHLWK